LLAQQLLSGDGSCWSGVGRESAKYTSAHARPLFVLEGGHLVPVLRTPVCAAQAARTGAAPPGISDHRPMAPTVAQLRTMSDDDIIRAHDDTSSMEKDPATALFLFDHLTEPRILPTRTYSQLFGASFEPVMRDSDITLRDLWQKIFQPFIGEYALQLVDIVDRHIRRADLQLQAASESDRKDRATRAPRLSPKIMI
jgi:hypothetical protein